jgi:ribosomal protein S18 acetylase RimI-like enzyme
MAERRPNVRRRSEDVRSGPPGRPDRAKEVSLEVEAANYRALNLYRAFDFEVVERTPYYRSAG